MPRKFLLALAISMPTAIALCASAHAQEKLPDLGGTYRCEPYPASCNNSGQTFTISQSGAKLTVKSDKGVVGPGNVTSSISVSIGTPWNAIGIVSSDGRTIEWSAGTRWRKE